MKPMADVAAGRSKAIMPILPKIIYGLWLDGLDAAPDLVRFNLRRWRDLNPGYTVTILDRGDVDRLLAGFPGGLGRLTSQALSDVVRARLLSDNGGIWVDASLLPISPLEAWLPAAMAANGFFAFERPASDRPLSSWFLAAASGNALMGAWASRVDAYWLSERRPSPGIPLDPVGTVDHHHDIYPYFWFHYLFQSMIVNDAGLAQAWAACGKWSAAAPHALQVALAGNIDLDPQLVRDILARAPVHKLDWRVSYPLELFAAGPGD